MLISDEKAKQIAILYYNDIYHLCYLRLQNEEEAADVTQDVFLLFQEKYESLEDDHLKAWLYAVANNKIKEQFRAIAKREKELIFGTDFMSKETTEILYDVEEENKVSNEEIELKKESIISSLNEKEFELFEMFYTKHMKYKEIAEILKTSENSVRTKVYRLRNKIKEHTSFIFMAILLLFMKFYKNFE